MDRIGFVGLGTMGTPMAQNLLHRGFSLTVYDLVPNRVDALVDAGAAKALSLGQLAQESDIVITMLPTGKDVEHAIFAADGLMSGLRPGSLLIDMSTISPFESQDFASRLHQHGVQMLDAPVARSSREAATGELLIMVGGPKALLAQAQPVFDALGTDVFYCGSHGMGTAMKLVNNLLNETILLATSEALVVGAKVGLTPEDMFTVLSRTNANNGHLQRTITQKTLRGDFEPGFKVVLGHKDLGLAIDLANRSGVPTILGAAAHQAAALALAAGKGNQDLASFITVLEEYARIQVRSTKVDAHTDWGRS